MGAEVPERDKEASRRFSAQEKLLTSSPARRKGDRPTRFLGFILEKKELLVILSDRRCLREKKGDT